jgi:hypothetical protein
MYDLGNVRIGSAFCRQTPRGEGVLAVEMMENQETETIPIPSTKQPIALPIFFHSSSSPPMPFVLSYACDVLFFFAKIPPDK